MNPLNAASSMKKIIVSRIAKRNALHSIQSAPATFSSIPVGDSRYRAALYFADPLVNAYQIRQWYEPMRQLAERTPVVVIVRNPATAVKLLEECPLPLFYSPTIADIEKLLETQKISAVFYVNQNIRNFQMMRFNEPAHIFVSHGESEKSYMWSNQLKAYDFVFSAGQAARDRLTKNMLRFDAVERTRLVGRPQIDVAYPAPVTLNPGFKTILYAPTWEGDRPSMSYGSVSTHGVAIIKSLIAAGSHNIVFRPHPRSGVNDPAYKANVKLIREILGGTHAANGPSFVFDESDSWGWQWATSDVCITDISAVAYDWMATGKPMLVTRPASPRATIDDSPALLKIPALTASDAPNTPAVLDRLLDSPNHDFADLVEYYFGDTTPGASMERFINESLSIIR